ncbi:MAG TPA: glycine--tRNA ligase subunit beta [Gammaproteobacteria bacterium]|jgi:glycyl-tRNA synthetase beta chain|nr:glycine--tRNA ligase subunit beta [Gammaproteobacteria bacterium]
MSDFLIEIQTEELPPKSLIKMAKAFSEELSQRLTKAQLAFDGIKYFATPRRLAVRINELAATQPDQEIERKGPALSAAYDASGKPTKACEGFARGAGIAVTDLIVLKSAQGEWVGVREKVKGQSIQVLLPPLVEQALAALPMQKRMRWGNKEIQFIRPVHSVMMLYGDTVIDGVILGCCTGKLTRGHRFHAPTEIEIPDVDHYESLLKTQGWVIADIESRREFIFEKTKQCVAEKIGTKADALMRDTLLDEVTGLVEWPVVLLGQFDADFLSLPKEVLISAMEDHQRYFPVEDKDTHNLLPYFVVVSNIESAEPESVVQGNQRVLRARLSDAAFFYGVDQKEKSADRLERLKGIVFQDKLGSLYDKSLRVSQLSAKMAIATKGNVEEAKQAGLLAKTDLMTNMVNEFPELQGVMGYYYASKEQLPNAVAIAMREQYLPRFAGDVLPENSVGQALALADRLDTLVGTFGVGHLPTGDKDPYGLRRAAVGVIRILIEREIDLDLAIALQDAVNAYQVQLANKEVVPQVLHYIQERLRAWCLDQGVSADVFASVAALSLKNPLDILNRIKAVQAFAQTPEAAALSIANKRVSNILAKYPDGLIEKEVSAVLFEQSAESALFDALKAQRARVESLSSTRNYTEALLMLSALRQPVDDFFEKVMVMTDDQAKRENRLCLLAQLRALFLQVADIALLQGGSEK